MVRVTVRADNLAGGILAAFALVVAIESIGAKLPVVRAVVAFVAVTFVPGTFFLDLVGLKPRFSAKHVVYVVGTSLLLIMALGLVLDLILPLIGYDRPLSELPLSVGVLGLSTALVALGDGSQSALSFTVPTLIAELDPRILFFSQLPFWAIVSIFYLNTTNDTRPITALLTLIAVIPILVVALPFNRNHLRLGVAMMALAVLYHKSLWLGHTFGGHASVVTIWEIGYWPTGGEVLLPNAVLMPAYAHLLGIHILTATEVIMPLFVVFIPLAAFLAFEQYVGATPAFLASSLFIFSHPFYYQYPSAPRASFPVLFLALVGAAIADDSLSSAQSCFLAVLFALGIVVSHYGTSYYVMFALIGVVILLAGYQSVDRIRNFLGIGVSDAVREEEMCSRPLTGSATVLTVSFVTFYTSAVISWYLFIGEGSKFRALLEHILNAYQSLFVQAGRGSTATRLATDYGSTAIGLSKSLYLTLALLLAFGFTVSYFRRFVLKSGSRFDDEFLALASCLFLLFGGSFVFSGEWGGGRPMMIVFSLGAVFTVVGALALGNSLDLAHTHLLAGYSHNTLPSGQSALAIIFAVFFVLNSGVASALVFGGHAPSNVPVTDLTENYDETDLAMHAWLADHRNETHQIYGDRLARAQTTDWMNGEIVARADEEPYRFKKKYNFEALSSSGIEDGYVLLLGHNIVEGIVEVDYVTTRKMSDYELDLDERNRIYTNGQAAVYFMNASSQ